MVSRGYQVLSRLTKSKGPSSRQRPQPKSSIMSFAAALQAAWPKAASSALRATVLTRIPLPWPKFKGPLKDPIIKGPLKGLYKGLEDSIVGS